MMNLNVFGRYISELTKEDENDDSLKARISRRKIYNTLVRVFDDQDKNIKRWLLGKPCIFYHPETEQYMTIEIGRDIEALYYFLLFCYKLNNLEEVSEDFRDYLALVISRSVYHYDGIC